MLLLGFAALASWLIAEVKAGIAGRLT